MKLSDIKGENSLDVVADLIEPCAEIMSDPEIVNGVRSNVPRIKIVKMALKKHKDSVIEILATLEQKTVEEYKKEMTLLSLPLALLDVLNDEALLVLFPNQSQKAKTIFGSATVNTEDAEQ